MSIAMTQIADVGFAQGAYNLAVDYALRPELPFDAVADVMPQNVDHPGTSITFRMMSEMASQTTALNEDEDRAPVDLASSTVTLSLYEYGNSIKMSAILAGAGYILPFDPIAAELIGYNAGLSMDTLARAVVEGGSQVTRGTVAGVAADVNITSAMTFTGAHARFLRNRLRGNNVRTVNDRFYVGYIHPDVAYDFQADTTVGSWSYAYSGSSELDPLKTASIGQFSGINWIETTRAGINANVGAGGTVEVYNTTVVGRQAIVKGYSQAKSGPYPSLVPTPVTDSLRRFSGIGWYWFGGYAPYRQASMYRMRTASSLAANT